MKRKGYSTLRRYEDCKEWVVIYTSTEDSQPQDVCMATRMDLCKKDCEEFAIKDMLKLIGLCAKAYKLLEVEVEVKGQL